MAVLVVLQDGVGPLGFAVEAKQWEVVGILLGARADPNTRVRGGHTVLVYACQQKSLDTVRQLLGAGATPDAPSSVSCAIGGGAVVLAWDVGQLLYVVSSVSLALCTVRSPGMDPPHTPV